ncbi:hypothetical protein I6A84_04515 [Frankia sp. CNm7]|uniref:Uncharacterized protein n=1 Tax=Frankia nepalensis TaxID=1836974 RepID=A0A937ULN9_9ACTN|nr:hypothetical protein [Frankia nepalensis]MBL7498732.1 hypothetical protein [Frankia nepalensis]MBL7508403.1 hypothetical protein [Frankia nepalensis]MBL7517403.1 hypothetical protein [Frankia nepalensis]MBL7626233.1 hypothetical protein [Frankia nepalensis]
MAWTTDSFHTAFSQYSLGDDGTLMPIEAIFDTKKGNGAIAAGEGWVYVRCATHTGVLRITIDLEPPAPIPDTDGWEAVVDVSYRSITGNTHLRDWEYTPRTDAGVLSHAGPGWYRIRIKTRGWDAGRALNVAFEPVEEHHLTLWPAPPHPEVIHKQR